MSELFSRADFRRLFAGQAISGFGDWMVTVALMAFVLELSGSSTAVGGVLLLRLLPAVAAAPLLARVAHRWPRKRTMLSADLVRAGVVVLIPMVAALWWVYLWAFVLEAASIVFLPARDALIPDLVDDERNLPLANGAILASSYGTIPLGAGAFAAVAALSPNGHGFIHSHPFVLVFIVDAVTFLVSFALVSRIRAGERAPTVVAGGPSGHFRDALRIPLVRSMSAATAAVSLALGALFSVGVVYVRDVLRAGDVQFGTMIALFGVGAAVGLGALHAVGSSNDIDNVRAGALLQGVTVGTMSLAKSIAAALIGAVAFGAATAVVLAAGMSALQHALKDEELVLAFGAFHIVTRAGLAASALAAGVAADLVSTAHLPLVGAIEPAQQVLLTSAIVVVVTSLFLFRVPSEVLECAPAG